MQETGLRMLPNTGRSARDQTKGKFTVCKGCPCCCCSCYYCWEPVSSPNWQGSSGDGPAGTCRDDPCTRAKGGRDLFAPWPSFGIWHIWRISLETYSHKRLSLSWRETGWYFFWWSGGNFLGLEAAEEEGGGGVPIILAFENLSSCLLSHHTLNTIPGMHKNPSRAS